MANTISPYNPILYAQEALILLENSMGMASRVHRGYDAERRTFNKGDTINIRKPGSFTVNDAPATAEDLGPSTTQLTLNQWKEVKFKLSDKELAFTTEQIIDEHIRPAAYEIENFIDQQLAALYAYIPWFYDIAATTVVKDVTQVKKVMRDNKVPMANPNNLHYMVGSALEAGLNELAAFTQQQGAGAAGVSQQTTGDLAQKYGYRFFVNQNTPDHTAGAMADGAGAIATGGASEGDTTVTIDDLTDTQTVKAGDSFVIAGNTQRYVFTEDGTVSSSALTGIGIYPAIVADALEDAIVTIRVDTHEANLAFHRNAFAIAFGKLPDALPNSLGANVASIQGTTGVSIRSRIYYVGNSSEVHVALDVLFGVKTLDANLACRACGA